MMAPGSRIGPATDAERQAVRNGSILGGKYDKTIDRESAYEVLLQRTEQRQAPAQSDSGNDDRPAAKSNSNGEQNEGFAGVVSDFLFGSTGPRGGRREGVVQTTIKSVVRRSAAQLVRGLLGRSEEHTSELQSLMRNSYA